MIRTLVLLSLFVICVNCFNATVPTHARSVGGINTHNISMRAFNKARMVMNETMQINMEHKLKHARAVHNKNHTLNHTTNQHPHVASSPTSQHRANKNKTQHPANIQKHPAKNETIPVQHQSLNNSHHTIHARAVMNESMPSGEWMGEGDDMRAPLFNTSVHARDLMNESMPMEHDMNQRNLDDPDLIDEPDVIEKRVLYGEDPATWGPPLGAENNKRSGEKQDRQKRWFYGGFGRGFYYRPYYGAFYRPFYRPYYNPYYNYYNRYYYW